MRAARYLAAALLAAGWLIAPSLPAAERPALEDFMRQVRSPRGGSSYAMLDGDIQHLRRGGEPESCEIYFGVLITPERMSGQLTVNGTESYLLGQNRTSSGGAASSSVIPMGEPAGKSLLDRMGVRAGDLTLDFLYWDTVGELEPRRVRTVPCRVVRLRSPDGAETADACISEEYFFPLKVEYRDASGDIFRTLEVSSFKKKNGLYYAEELSLFGPGWRTRINFDRAAEVGLSDPAAPVSVVRPY